MTHIIYGLLDRETKRFVRYTIASEKKIAKAYFARVEKVYRDELKVMYKIVEIADINEKGEIHD